MFSDQYTVTGNTGKHIDDMRPEDKSHCIAERGISLWGTRRRAIHFEKLNRFDDIRVRELAARQERLMNILRSI